MLLSGVRVPLFNVPLAHRWY